MKEMELREQIARRIGAIYRMGQRAKQGTIVMSNHWVQRVDLVVGVCVVGIASSMEGIMREHIFAHAGCPFLHLWAQVEEKGIGRPSTEEHYFVRGFSSQEEGHGSTGSNGVGTHVGMMVSKEHWGLKFAS